MCWSKESRPTSKPSASRWAPWAGAWPRSSPRARTVGGSRCGPRCCPRSHRPSTARTCAGWPRWVSAPCTSRPTPRRDLARRACSRRGRGRLAPARGGSTRSRRVRCRATERGAAGADPRRVRPDREVLTGTIGLTVPEPVAGELLEHHAPVAPSTTRHPAGRRRRARRVRRVRSLPSALPHVPRLRARVRVAARADRGNARGRARGRARRRRVHRVDGDVRAVSRLRSRVPVVGAVRAPHGRHARSARRTRAAENRSWLRRLAEWAGFALVLPRHRLLIALTWVTLVGQRLHLVPRRFGLPRLSARSLREPLHADEHGDAVLFTGCVMDAWQRDVHRAALTVMRAAGARPALPGPGGDCCGALHAHAGGSPTRDVWRGRVIRSMPGDAPVVVDSAGCGAAMKDYGRLLGTPEAVAFSARVQDFSEWLAAQRTTHPARHRRRAGRAGPVPSAARAARAGLRAHRARPGVRPCATPTTTACAAAPAAPTPCSSPSSPGRSVSARCVPSAAPPERVTQGGTPIVVSANPGCAMHLGAAGLIVRHPAELIAEALEDSGA